MGFVRFPLTLPVKSDPMFASGVMITAFAKDTNDKAANIFVKTEANIMMDRIDSLRIVVVLMGGDLLMKSRKMDYERSVCSVLLLLTV